MSQTLYSCPECNIEMEWMDPSGTDPGHYRCPTCNSDYYDIDELKRKMAGTQHKDKEGKA